MNERDPHPTTLVEVGHRRADIDVGMADLVRLLWENDVDTQSCCQGPSGPRGVAQLNFPLDSARRFYTWIDAASIDGEPGSFRKRLGSLLRGNPDSTMQPMWAWRVELVERRRAGTSWGFGVHQDCDIVKFTCPAEHVAPLTAVLSVFPFPGMQWWNKMDADAPGRALPS